MCGIAGIFGRQRQQVPAMLQRMQSRGPDAMRQHAISQLDAVLGHVRLSILDLDPRSHQPFASPCGRYQLVFNGEIYNYLTLREQLERRGVRFATRSDTEVLLHWLIAHGHAGLRDLEGMFALALLDVEQDQLLLARDHIGEKPLYYAQNPQDADDFAFASDLQALRLIDWVDTSTNLTAVTDYLRFLYSPHPNTLYEGIRELPPGSFVVRQRGCLGTVQKFYDLESAVEPQEACSYDQAVEQFRERFHESVRMRLQSDVPVGLFLSGGLDSNSILAAANQLGAARQLKAYTVSYDQRGTADGDESHLARQAAEHFGVEHHVAPFADDQPLLATVERTLQLFGQPYGNATVLVSDMISQAAAQRSRVCLVGDGGDELLSGYPRHRALPWLSRYRRWLRPFSGGLRWIAGRTPAAGPWEVQVHRLRRLSETLTLPLGESFLRWTTYMPGETIRAATGLACDSGFYEQLNDVFQRNQAKPLLAASLVDLQSFVPCKLMHCADRAGMAHSLELRCPFLAPPLIETALGFPEAVKLRGRRVKPILADACWDQLPPTIRTQPKRPFNPPLRRYLRGRMEELTDRLTASDSSATQLLGAPLISQTLTEFKTGQRDHSTLLWGLLVLNQWLDEQASAARPRAAA